jgi:hypothetical protein
MELENRVRLLATVVISLALSQCVSVSSAFAQGRASTRAEALVRSAIEKMGGDEKLRSLNSIQIEGIGHTYAIEQSERPEGPWIVTYDQVTEARDYKNQRLRRTTQNRSFQGAQWTTGATLIVADNVAARLVSARMFAGAPTDRAEAEERLALSPERVLLTALEATDLHLERDSSLQGSTQHVVAFTWQNAPVRVYLSISTAMPTAIEFTRAYPDSFFWGVWGEVKTRTCVSLWTLEPGGIRYPRQWDVERNGTTYQSFTVTSMTLNPQLDAESFSIPAEVKKAFESAGPRLINDVPLGLPNRPLVEIVPGVVQIPGSWNVTLVRQPDGIVVIEAPISSGYSDKVIAEARKRFPSLPIKAVISTSDAWPHIGGVREYVARSVPVFVLDLNQPILERLVLSSRHSNPDALDRGPRKKPIFKIVSGKTIVGSGPNRLELYPIRTETGERMIMVYFPEHALLYGSDLLQPSGPASFFMPEYLSELAEAVRREKLIVNKVIAMHLRIRPWADIEAAVTKAIGAH